MIKVYSANIHMQASRNLNRKLKLLESQQVHCLLGWLLTRVSSSCHCRNVCSWDEHFEQQKLSL